MFRLSKQLRYQVTDDSCPAPLFTSNDISIQQVAMDVFGKKKGNWAFSSFSRVFFHEYAENRNFSTSNKIRQICAKMSLSFKNVKYFFQMFYEAVKENISQSQYQEYPNVDPSWKKIKKNYTAHDFCKKYCRPSDLEPGAQDWQERPRYPKKN